MMEPSVETVAEHDALEGIPAPAATRRVVGHDEALGSLLEARDSGRLHHGWLLQGPRGIGKATLAFAFARRLLGSDADDGGVAERQIANGVHPNLIHVTRPEAERGSGFKTQITVDEIRKLNRFFQTTSGNGRWRIAIIDPVDDLNRNAANALLKILEEPPERALFLIVNHLPGRLLPTIRSRCRVLRVEPLKPADLAAALRPFDLPTSPAELDLAIARADGSVRAVITLLTSGGLEIEGRLDALLQAPEPEWHGIQALADALSQKGEETAFDLAMASLFERLAKEGEAAVARGQLGRAAVLARLWEAEGARIREGLAFNLDRKQLLITHFRNRFEARAMLKAS